MKSRLDFLMFATAFGKNKVGGFTQRLPTTTEINDRDIYHRIGSSYFNI